MKETHRVLSLKVTGEPGGPLRAAEAEAGRVPRSQAKGGSGDEEGIPGREKARAKAPRLEVLTCCRNSLETSVAGALWRMAWRRATVAGRQSQSAHEDASENIHIKGGWSQAGFGGGMDGPC